VNAALQGDVIQIQAGTYTERLTIQDKNNVAGASESSRILIEAAPGLPPGSVLLKPPAAVCLNGHAVLIRRSKFVTIRGLTITGAVGAGVVLLGGSQQNQAIHIERSRIVGNSSASCPGGGIAIALGNPDTLIVNTLIYANGGNGITFADAGGGPHWLIQNTIHGNGWNGVSIVLGNTVTLVNNVITNNGRASGTLGGRQGVRRTGLPKQAPQAVDLLNNLICGNRLGEIQGPVLDSTDSGNLTPKGSEGNGISASPGCGVSTNVYADLNGPDGLPDTVDDDFNLVADSPAIDGGIDPRTLGLNVLFSAILEADFSEQASRPSDGNADRTIAFDIGAFEIPNDPPIANAGPDQSVFKGTLVILDGTQSSDPEGASLTYNWTIVSRPPGSSVSLSNPTSSTPQFIPFLLGDYVFQLVVNDGEFNSAPATIRVTSVNRPPPANANGPYSGRVGEPIQFAGAGSDPDGDPITFSWNFGDSGTASGATPTHTYKSPGTFNVILTVADPFGGIGTSQTTATVITGIEITALTPGSGILGAEVTIQGRGFEPTSGNTIVRFNGTQAFITSITQTTIRTFVPLGATTGRITVETSQGIATSGNDFIVLLRHNFSLTATPSIGSAVQGTSTSYALQIVSTGIEPFTGLSQLTTGPLPAGVTAVVTPPILGPSTTGILTLTTTNSTAVGQSVIELRAASQIVGSTVIRTADITLGVQAPGQTVLIGQVRDGEDHPLAGVSIKQGGSTIIDLGMSDAGGNFFIPLSVTGPQVFLVDGSTASTPGINYPTVPITVEIQPGVVNTLGFIPRLHGQPTTKLVSITPGQATVLTDPDLPGFSMTIPSGVQIIGWDGKPNTRFSVVTVPIDRSPLPPLPPELAARQVYLFSFGKMGGGTPTGNIPIDTPNDVGGLPGEKIDLYYFNEAPDGTAPNRWEKYGTGTISSDGTRIITDINPATGLAYGIPRFCCGARVNVPPPSPPRPGGGPSGGKSGAGQMAGEPVDTATGFFYLDKTDMVLSAILPIAITRTYRTQLTNAGPFGIGTSWPYDIFLEPPPNSSPDTLILFTPGNRQDLFSRQANGSFVNTSSPALRGVVVTVAAGIRSLRFKDGSLWRFDSAGKLISQADRRGNTVTLTRDPQGRVTQIREPAGRALTISYTGSNLRIDIIRDPIGREMRYGYDASGRLSSVTVPAGGITRYVYDAANRMVSVTDPRNITFLANEYDGAGRVIRQTQADGGVWTFAYTTTGDFISQTAVADPKGNTTTYRFNSEGFLTSQTDALGQITTFERQSGTNLVLAIIDSLNRRATFSYDANGNVTSVRDPAGNIRRFEYEAIFDKLARMIDPLGQITRFEYDANGDLTATVDSAGSRTTIVYNDFGQPKSMTDALGNTSTFAYDSFGNLASIADPLGNQAQRVYDLVSRLIEQTDPRGRSTRFTYDGLNRITQVIDVLNSVTSFGYDGNGNLVSVTDARGSTITHTYDVMDRLATRTDPVGEQESYQYDQSGNLTRATDRKGQVSTFTYDRLNRRISSGYADGTTTRFVYDGAGLLTEVTDSSGGTILNAYDTLDRLVAETTDLGTVGYQYDELGRRTRMDVTGQVPVTYAYDAASRLRQVIQGIQIVDIQYDALGRRSRLTLPNGVSTAYGYDEASRVTELIYRNTSGVLGNLTYQYDAAGNRVAVGGTFARTLMPHPVPNAIYDAANRQLQFGDKIMTYDANGNLVTYGDSTAETILNWDARDQLIGLRSPTISALFDYDPLGRRSRRMINGQSHMFQYDGRNVVNENTLAGMTFYLGGLGLDEVWVRREDDLTDFIIADPLGSTVALLSPTGTVNTDLTYEPFGNTARVGASTDNSLGFTGREDDGTGFFYYRARYYHPGLARYISEDPLRFGDGINPYTYVRNSPANARDPLGLYTIVIHGVQLGIPPFKTPGEGAYAGTQLLDAISKTGETVAEVRWSGNLFSGDAAADALYQLAQLISNAPPGEPRNIISHSWGTVLAANYLAATGTPVDLLVTMGSPMSAFTASPDSAAVWVNFSSTTDPISWGSLSTSAEKYVLLGAGHSWYWKSSYTKREILKRIKEQKKKKR
jgi:RHS repeat-associated protein